MFLVNDLRIWLLSRLSRIHPTTCKPLVSIIPERIPQPTRESGRLAICWQYTLLSFLKEIHDPSSISGFDLSALNMQFSKLLHLTLITIIGGSVAQYTTGVPCVFNDTITTTATARPTGVYKVFYPCPTSPVFTGLQCCTGPIDDTHKSEWMGCKDQLPFTFHHRVDNAENCLIIQARILS